MKEKFISEAINIRKEDFDFSEATIGEPGVPKKFTWRKKVYDVAEVLKKWKTYGDCTHGSGERYLRKHWFQIRTSDGIEMTLYFQRRVMPRTTSKARWYLYAISEKVE